MHERRLRGIDPPTRSGQTATLTLIRKTVATLVVIALIILAWTKSLDDAAIEATTDTFKRALTVAALARGFNGVISVAQGTEVAIQPVGVGVTLTLGQILDPLNDLVERFSLLALVASVSLGAQLMLAEMAGMPWLAALVTVAGLTLIGLLWWRRSATDYGFFIKTVGIVILARFLLTFVLLLTHWLNQGFLQERQEAAVAQLRLTSATIESINQASQPGAPGAQSPQESSGLMDSINEFFSATQESVDVQTQLDTLKLKIEASVEHIVTIIVIFLLQTLILPLLGAWLFIAVVRAFWRSENPLGAVRKTS